MSDFEKLAHADPDWHRGSADELAHHTAGVKDAEALTKGYLRFLRRIVGWQAPRENRCLDLGAGAGYITSAFQRAGLSMAASEHTDDGVALIRRLNPGLAARKINLSEFKEPGAYDLIFSREVYLFTRTNAFPDQSRVVSDIIDSLRPGGVFLLVGSDVCAPDCLDYGRLIELFRKDPRLALVTSRYYEAIFKHLDRLIAGRLSYGLIELLLTPVIRYKAWRRGFARIYLIGFVKK